MSNIRRAIGFAALGQYAIQIVSFTTIALLARLLTPAEIGVFAVASSIVFLAIEVRSLGIGQYLVREKHLDETKIRAATGLMLLVSWSLAAFIVLLAPWAAEFYREPALESIFSIIAGTFLVAPFSSVPFALLTRAMAFRQLFIVKLCSSLSRAGITLVLVLLGYSYHGLALGVLAGAIVECVAVNVYRPPGVAWMPSFRGVRSLVQFGVFTSAAGFMQKFTLGVPDLVLGRIASMADVGLFSRGLGLVSFLNKLVVQAVAPVVLPYLASIKRGGGSVSEAYLNAMVLQGGFSLPVFAVVNVLAHPMIVALFGDQWLEAVPLASALAFWAMLQSVHCFSSMALLAVERESVMLYKETAVFVVRLAVIACAAQYGLMAVAWAMVFSAAFEFGVNAWVVKRELGLGYARVAKSLSSSLLVAVGCWLCVTATAQWLEHQEYNCWLQLAIGGTVAVLAWLLALRLTGHPVWAAVAPIVNRLTLGRNFANAIKD